MIKINMLPEELKKKEELSLSKIGVSLKAQGENIKRLAIGIGAALVIFHLLLAVVSSLDTVSFNKLSKKDKEILPGKTEYKTLKAEVDSTNLKAASIDSLMANRFSWSKKLNDLSDSLTQGIWLTELSYDEKPFDMSVPVKVSTRATAGGGKKEITKSETKKVYQKFLNISGYASSMGEQGTALIGKFIKNMKDNPMFFSGFKEIKLQSIKTDKVQGQEVMIFKITCFFRS